jgi:hypothetical protein
MDDRMRIVAKVYLDLEGGGYSLIHELGARGIIARTMKKGLIVELPIRGVSDKSFDIPPEVEAKNDVSLIIDAIECGDSDEAMVVCGLRGLPLRPYRAHKSRSFDSKKSAFFSVFGKAITVHAVRDQGESSFRLSIDERQIMKYGDYAKIVTTELWQGRIYQLPRYLDRYTLACQAAQVKADCHNCDHIHFGEDIRKHNQEQSVDNFRFAL